MPETLPRHGHSVVPSSLPRVRYVYGPPDQLGSFYAFLTFFLSNLPQANTVSTSPLPATSFDNVGRHIAALVSAGPDYQDPLVMINARLFKALVNAPSNIGHSCFPRLLAALPLASHRRCGRSRRSPAHRCGALALPRPMAARRRSPAAASLLPF